jgi:hypothetical protein
VAAAISTGDGGGQQRKEVAPPVRWWKNSWCIGLAVGC